MGKRIEGRLQALEQARQSQGLLGRKVFCESLTEPGLFTEGTGQGLTHSREELSALSRQGWQVILLCWAADWPAEPGEKRLQLEWD